MLKWIDADANATLKDLIGVYRRLDNLRHDNKMVNDSKAIKRVNVSTTSGKPKCSKRKAPKSDPSIGWDMTKQPHQGNLRNLAANAVTCTSSRNVDPPTTNALSAET